MRIDLDAGVVELGVKDLIPDTDGADPFAPGFVSRSRLQAGTRAHQQLQGERSAQDPEYRAEVFLRGELLVDGLSVRIEGRADGVQRADDGLVVEEIKSVLFDAATLARVSADRFPDYVLQLRVYLWLLGRSQGLPVRGRLTLVALGIDERRSLEVAADDGFVERLVVERVRALAAAERARQTRFEARRAAADGLALPHPLPRLGQERLQQAAEQAFAAGEALLVSAPTGLGKTAAALTAALRVALASDRQVLWLSSRTTQQRLVLETFDALRAQLPLLQALQLSAKEKACLNDVVHCHPEACEYASDYPLKLRSLAPLERLREAGRADAVALETEGQRCRACPFQLGLDLVDAVDLVVGDSNYAFDPRVALSQFQAPEARGWLVVVDEAHALQERVRQAWSPRLAGTALQLLAETLGCSQGALELSSVLRGLEELLRDAAEAASDPVRVSEQPALWAAPNERKTLERLLTAYEQALMLYLGERGPRAPGEPRDPALELYGQLRHLVNVLGQAGPDFVTLWEEGPAGGSYGALCLDPARPIGRRVHAFGGALLMSATLDPLAAWSERLGLSERRSTSLRLPSPFPSERRRVLVAPGIGTTLRERGRHHHRVARLIEQVVGARRGHYVAFFPSFAYLRAVAAHLAPDEQLELLEQGERMDETQRAAMLDRLALRDGRGRLLLAVLGGIFAEGVDYPGDSLIGVIAVSPGLPQLSPERELIRDYQERRSGRGFEEAYVAPGMLRVVQAAGRLIRSETDRGVIVLVGRRFRERTYADCFPADWQDSGADMVVHANLERELRGFWQRIDVWDGEPDQLPAAGARPDQRRRLDSKP